MDHHPPFDNNFDQFKYQQFTNFSFVNHNSSLQKQDSALQHSQSLQSHQALEAQQLHQQTLNRQRHDQGQYSPSLGVLDNLHDSLLIKEAQQRSQLVNSIQSAQFTDDNQLSLDIDKSLADSEDSSRLPRATLKQKIEVLDWFHASERKSQQQTVSHFQKLAKFAITKSSFNRWVKDEDKLRENFKNISYAYRNSYKTKPNLKFPEVNRALELFYEQSLYERNSANLSERSIYNQFEKFAFLLDPDFDLAKSKRSNGWLHHFKKKNAERKKLIENFFAENEEMLNLKYLNNERMRIKSVLGEYKLSDIYHFDELKVSSDIPGRKNFDCSTLEIQEITVGICVNGDGSDLKDLVIVGKTAEVSETSDYYSHPAGNFTAEIFQNYVSKWDNSLAQAENPRNIVLLVDTLYAHIIDTSKLKHVHILYFSPNFVSYLSYPPDLFHRNMAALSQFSSSSKSKSKRPVLLNGNAKKMSKSEVQPISLGISRIFKTYFKLNLFEYYLFQLVCHKSESMAFGECTPETLVSVINDIQEADLIYFANESWELFKQENGNYEKLTKSESSEKYTTVDSLGNHGLVERAVPKNIVSNCFKSCDILPIYDILGLNVGQTNTVNPTVFSDYSKEHKLLRILTVFESKKLIFLNKRKPYLTLADEAPSDFIPFKIEDILFPCEEVIINDHISDESIVDTVKVEFNELKKIQESSGKSSKPFRNLSLAETDLKMIDNQIRQITSLDSSSEPVTTDQLAQQINEAAIDIGGFEPSAAQRYQNDSFQVHDLLEISKFFNNIVRPFLISHSGTQFSKSEKLFRKFLLTFILESNDFLMMLNEFGVLESSDKDFDKFFTSLSKRLISVKKSVREGPMPMKAQMTYDGGNPVEEDSAQSADVNQNEQNLFSMLTDRRKRDLSELQESDLQNDKELAKSRKVSEKVTQLLNL